MTLKKAPLDTEIQNYDSIEFRKNAGGSIVVRKTGISWVNFFKVFKKEGIKKKFQNLQNFCEKWKCSIWFKINFP